MNRCAIAIDQWYRWVVHQIRRRDHAARRPGWSWPIITTLCAVALVRPCLSADGLRAIPVPLLTQDVAAIGDELRLDSAQYAELFSRHEQYLREFGDLYHERIVPYVTDEAQGHFGPFIHPDAEEMTVLVVQRERIIASVADLDRAFIDYVAGIVTDEQAERLSLVRLRRQQQRDSQIVRGMLWPFRVARYATYNVAAAIDDMSLPDELRASIEPLTANYERRYTRLLSEFATALRRAYIDHDQLVIELGIEDAHGISGQNEVLEEGWREMSARLVIEANRISALNRQLIANMAGTVPPEVLARIRAELLRAAFPGIPVNTLELRLIDGSDSQGTTASSRAVLSVSGQQRLAGELNAIKQCEELCSTSCLFYGWPLDVDAEEAFQQSLDRLKRIDETMKPQLMQELGITESELMISHAGGVAAWAGADRAGQVVPTWDLFTSIGMRLPAPGQLAPISDALIQRLLPLSNATDDAAARKTRQVLIESAHAEYLESYQSILAELAVEMRNGKDDKGEFLRSRQQTIGDVEHRFWEFLGATMDPNHQSLLRALSELRDARRAGWFIAIQADRPDNPSRGKWRVHPLGLIWRPDPLDVLIEMDVAMGIEVLAKQENTMAADRSDALAKLTESSDVLRNARLELVRSFDAARDEIARGREHGMDRERMRVTQRDLRDGWAGVGHATHSARDSERLVFEVHRRHYAQLRQMLNESDSALFAERYLVECFSQFRSTVARIRVSPEDRMLLFADDRAADLWVAQQRSASLDVLEKLLELAHEGYNVATAVERPIIPPGSMGEYEATKMAFDAHLAWLLIRLGEIGEWRERAVRVAG